MGCSWQRGYWTKRSKWQIWNEYLESFTVDNMTCNAVCRNDNYVILYFYTTSILSWVPRQV